MPDHTAYIVLHERHFTSAKTPVGYVSHIVYGAPRVEAILVGSCLVAILEYAPAQEHYAKTTFDRLGSFGSIGASFTYDLDVALREFAVWTRHYAPGCIVGHEPEPISVHKIGA